MNTRVYWRCVTNDQYTAEKCVNNTILDERELLDALDGEDRAILELSLCLARGESCDFDSAFSQLLQWCQSSLTEWNRGE